ncbi:MAG: AbrB family transcriptional regulator [Rhodobacteraceae bacterium]|nr:AbrB family transcriptional regulator [Paracoccaceae bacterium]
MHSMHTTALTLGIGALGAVVAWALGLPAPFLTGPALLVTAASLLGLQTHVPPPLRDISLVLIGIGMGTGVTPQVLDSARHWPLPLITLAGLLLIILFGGAGLVRWLSGQDTNTARLAATPGHLSFVLALSTGAKADLPFIAVVQSVRVLLLIVLVPAVATMLTGADVPMPASRGMPMPMPALLGLSGLAAGLGWALKHRAIPAALLLAGMAVSAAAHGTGQVPGTLPLWVEIPAFAIMGTLIGTRFSGVTPALVARALGASAVLSALACTVTFAAAWGVHTLGGLPMVDLLIAFAPGGLETMAAISILLGADPAFVALHHVFRLVFLAVLVPHCITADSPAAAPR